jgi:hypothetical protein
MVWTAPQKRIGMWACRLCTLAILFSCVGASRPDPVRQALEAVHQRTQHELTFRLGVQWSLGPVGDCTTFALHNYLAAKALGFQPEIWSVVDERGEGHAVVAVGEHVLDNRFRNIQTRQGLSRIGYRFRCPVDNFNALIRQPTLPAMCMSQPVQLSAGAAASPH